MASDHDRVELAVLAASLGALIGLLIDARDVITNDCDMGLPKTVDLLERIEAFLGPIADKLGV